VLASTGGTIGTTLAFVVLLAAFLGLRARRLVSRS
jgi:uncharacterized protein (TIGR03382 family)